MASSAANGTAKSDTSRRPPAIKNPLLSSQVTGLTLDDFAPVAVLPPAAPLPPIAREPSESTGPAKPAIFSSQPAESGVIPDLPQDTDSFSEIDLSAASEPAGLSSSRPPTAADYNPLEDLEDSESRPLLPGTDGGPSSYLQQTSSLTAQFAAQLPTVASTVFSTFSRVIKGNSPVANDQQTAAYGSFNAQPEFQNTIHPLGEASSPFLPSAPSLPLAVTPSFGGPLINSAACEPFPSNVGDQPLNAQLASPPPPTFYNPDRVASVASCPAPPPPAAGSGLSNTYRLGGSKKKTYAHIPGLSTTHHTGPGPLGSAAQTPAPVPFGVPPLPTPPVAQPFADLPVRSDPVSHEVNQPEDSAKSKPSLFGYHLPTNLLDKLPSPGFGGGADQFVDQPLSPLVVPPTESSSSSATASVGSFFAPPTAFEPSAAIGAPAVTPYSSLSAQSSLVGDQPPPTFYTPGQIPSVPVAPSTSSVASRNNPYSSARRAPGVGPYKNPLVTAPVSGPVFLPNQLPPTAAQKPESAVLASPPNIFAPPPPPASVVPALFDPVAEPLVSLNEPIESTPQTGVLSIFSPAPVAEQQSVPEEQKVVNSFVKHAAVGADSLFQPLSAPPKEPPVVPSIHEPLATPVQHHPIGGLPGFGPNSQLSGVSGGVDELRTASEHIVTQPNVPTLHSAPAAQREFTSFFDSAPEVTSGAPKTIVDSRSKSSENVLSPPPRPNSNLSEPATIFPGAVPPAGIFLPDTVPSAVPPIVQRQQSQEQQPTEIDGNANSLSSFFGQTSTPVSLIPSQTVPEPTWNGNVWPPAPEPALEVPTTNQLPEPAPAINPSDFFNSNTVLPRGSESDSKTGQHISSVPLFSFFGQAASPPAAALPPVPPQETLEANDQTDGKDEAAEEQERFVGVLNEPIFSSDNLFDFKPSAYQDAGPYSQRQPKPGDQSNGLGGETSASDSMAAMAATSVGGLDTTTAPSVAESSTNVAYRPTYNHWFYKREVEGKVLWSPFTMADSLALEDAWKVEMARGAATADDPLPPAVIVHTDGGRWDVSIRDRTRTPVYWNGAANEVRRCSWFYKNLDSRFVPYEEKVAEQLEGEYKDAATTGEWHRRVTIPNGETVVFHGPSVIVHFLKTQNPDTWGGSSPVPSTTNRPRVVKRGIDEFNIDDDEPEKIDHLMFMVHGIGEACDLRFRRVEEVVDEFRSISAQLVQSHYRSAFDRSDIGRVEILPISWHDDLHSEESGVDEKLKSITLESIPKLRHFTNDTLLDVLFYTSPMFCQSIIDAVGNSLNRLYTLFCQRNPSFAGGVSLAGHSLGSLILFDLLCHQKKATDPKPMETENSENPDADSVPPLPQHATVHHRPLVRKCSQQINYEVGPAGTGQPYITYPQLLFQPKKFFALGSPIGMFVTIRGIDALGLNFGLPTCDGFFNIFHPYDPVAYRIEALINPELSSLRPVLIPHHKGRKRMHLELKETMVRVGNDLKQRVSDVFRNTLDTVYALTALNSSRPDPKAIEKEVNKVIQDQLKFEQSGSTSNLAGGSDVDNGETSIPLGRLNQSRRVDYVLQEAPFEFINEYLFALSSHVCYWDSEDTMLFLMKEIYSTLGVQADIQVPQQTMTIERPLSSTSPDVGQRGCSPNNSYNLFPQPQPSTSMNAPSATSSR
ncbi:proline-rich protein 36 [Anopheles cruzii]|uniref:proline-rich protein 36 n=1 Tax=Anopheles cruzii TaxID=68878 RepID=UPI0022EC4AC2|nr:proline-rich protein 36 [Anopheles cruzii]